MKINQRVSLLHAIADAATRKYRVDGVGRPKFDFHTGAANPVTSRLRHVEACAERWTRVHEAALAAPGDDLDDPGALPPDPHAGVNFDELTMPELDAANVESERVFFEHALVPCEHCGRRFRRDALRKHRVSCTASRPFSKPLARQGPERVKVSNWR